MKIGTLILVVAALVQPLVGVAEERADWWQAQREVTATLIQTNASLAALVNRVGQLAPTNGQDAVFRLCVFTRAGMGKEAIRTLHEIKRLCPELENYQVSCIYHNAGEERHAWDMAQATAEVFADNVTDLPLENFLLRHMMDEGWTVDRVDRWLASRPKGKNNFWIKERLRFNSQHGGGEALEQELAARVRANPKDIAGAIAFLEALVYARGGRQNAGDLAWFAKAVKPELATDASEMASRLVTLQCPREAVQFWRQAVAIPLKDGEVRNLAMMRQRAMSGETLRAIFAVQTREELAECLLKLEQTDEALKWMEEASEIREKNHLGRNALFAGQVQGASGQRVIEGQIKAEEATSADDPKYWSERAQYYRGRKEAAQEADALKKGLALTVPQPAPERRGKGYLDWRSRLLADYALFLAREKRDGEAVALLRKELAEAPATSESTQRAAYLLAFDFEKQLSVEDAVLWTWLEHRTKWEYTEERLLWRMLDKANRAELDKPFARAEKFASGDDPSRAHTLGWIENRMGFAKRSIPLLEYAVEKAQDKDLKENAVFSLFESYLDTGDWRHAEAVFPDATRRLTAHEAPEWYSRIAVLAAKAGAKADAMRIWGRVANIDLSATEAVVELSAAGLKDELIAFYRDMRKALPASDIPGKVLATLQPPDAGKPDTVGGE